MGKEKKRSLEQVLKQVEEKLGPAISDEETDCSGEIPLQDAVDREILMHREAHFGGSFPLMLDYYRKGGKGVNTAIEQTRLEQLALIEKQSGKNLAALLLSGADAEKIARSREVYRQLRALYESTSKKKTDYPRLIADLILSEEQEPTKEIEAIAAEGSKILPSLLQLLQAKEFYDPLFPGYGQAPTLAARCLAHLPDRRSIIALFEALGDDDFFADETIYEALREIGQPAKEFLLRVLASRPVTYDNEKAVQALIHFKEDPELARFALTQLRDDEVWRDPAFANYLILLCEPLKDPADREEFLALAKRPGLDRAMKLDIETVAAHWNDTFLRH